MYSLSSTEGVSNKTKVIQKYQLSYFQLLDYNPCNVTKALFNKGASLLHFWLMQGLIVFYENKNILKHLV